jgi:hypothetical protein
MKYRKNIELVDSDAISISERVTELFGADHRRLRDGLIYDYKTGMMSYCLDMYTMNEYVYNYLTYVRWEFTLKGVDMSALMPVPMKDNGELIDLDYQSIESIKKCCPRFPISTEDKSMVLTNAVTEFIYSTNEKSRWSDWMRPVAAVNAQRKMLGLPILHQDVTNDILAQIPDIVASCSYSVRLVTEPISSIYEDEPDGSFNSCMASCDAEFFELYDYLQRKNKLGMIEILNGDGDHAGRALIWYGSNPDDVYLDRIYTYTRNSVKISGALKAVKEYCEANGIEKCVHNTCENDIGLRFVRFSIDVDSVPSNFNSFPYVDSMRYWFSDERLRNYKESSAGHLLATMDDTDGTCEYINMDDMVLLADGELCHVDDATYVERHNEYYHNDNVCHCIHGETDELIYECERLDDNHYDAYSRAHRDHVTRCIDGMYCLTDDVEAVGRVDAGYAHRDELFQMPDGIWLYNEDEEAIAVREAADAERATEETEA